MTPGNKNKPVVLVSEPLTDRAMDWLSERAEVRRCSVQKDGMQAVYADLAEAEGLVVRTYTIVDDKLLDRAPKLRVVGRAGVAIDNIDVPACRSRGVEVVHTPEANTLAVVDYTVRMIIELNRRFWPMSGPIPPEEFHRQRKQLFGRFLADCTLGVIGFGRIGSKVGRAAAALGMRVLYNDLLDIKVDFPSLAVDKPTLYAESDIITIHTTLNPSTRGLINAEAIAQFRPRCQFINAARGQVVNYRDLAEALKSGQISAAAIDCHDPEPPPEDYPLWGLDNVILTPHVAARVPQAIENMCDVVLDVMAVIDGDQPRYPAADEISA